MAAEQVKAGRQWGGRESSRDPELTDVGFHFHVARFTGDPILLFFADALRNISVEISNGERVPPQVDTDLAVSHEHVEAAIKMGDPARAESLMREHISEYVSILETDFPYLLDHVIEWG
ncbi:hypothetical protein GCM10010377_68170 [Streptomyces viridiviolaceus]|nr:hypothetical protein GCM10010377_68170 [Streptomyces viridiviolaceus]